MKNSTLVRRTPIRSRPRPPTAITRSAKGERCLVRIPGVCRDDRETTVFAHLNGAGLGIKHCDALGAYACFWCHQVLDGQVPSEHPRAVLLLWHLQGIARTIPVLVRKGLVKLS